MRDSPPGALRQVGLLGLPPGLPPQPTPRAWRLTPLLPWLVLALSLLVVAASAATVARGIAARERARFDNAVQSTEDRIRARFTEYAALLAATSALFAAEPEVSPARFHAYAQGLRLRARYPGIQALAYSARVPAADLPAHVERQRALGEAGFRAWPAATAGETITVTYIEPHDPRNTRVLGFDLASEANRREAMERARDSGEPAATRRITLVQEIDSTKQPGFLLLMPLYRGGLVPDTVEERRQRLTGYVSCTFGAHDLFQRIFGTEESPRVGLRVYDGHAPVDESGLLFASAEPSADALSRDRLFRLAGAGWTIRYVALQEPAPPVIPIILAIGAAMAAALFLLFRQQVRGRWHAEDAARALARSEARLRTLIERAPVAIAVFREQVIVYANPYLVSALGHEAAEDLVGRPALDLVLPDDRPALAAALSAAPCDQAEAAPRAFELRQLRKDGAVVDTEGLILPISFDGGPARIGVWQTTTERKQLAARLMQVDRMIAVGTLAAGVGHEINNPLSFISHNLQFLAEELRRRGDPGPEVMAALADAREGADRVRRIVGDLRTFARADPEQRHTVDVGAALDYALGIAANEIRHRAHLVRDRGPLPPVFADEGRLGQVFINLLVNAAQAIPEGDAAHHAIRLVTRTDGDGWAVVQVVDSGAGIAPEHLSRIFDPFFTTKAQGDGNGLGLAICHGIVSGLGGQLQVQSELGAGTTVTVRLPPAPAAAAEDRSAPAASRRPSPASPRLRVLVVDDEAALLRSTERALRGLHQVETESEAARALARVQAGERFDVILCDLMMPQMTGMELHARLSAAAPEQAEAMIFLTGGAFTEAARAFLESHQRLCLSKPVTLAELHRTIAELTEHRLAAATTHPAPPAA